MDDQNSATMTVPDEVDPWTARFARDPVGQVPIDLLCLMSESAAEVDASASVVETLRRKGRLGKVIPVRPDPDGHSWGVALAGAMSEVAAPLFVISDDRAEWNRDILERLLKAIDLSDLALGARPCGAFMQRTFRTISSLARGLIWGAGVIDPLTPYKLGRTEVFRKFPLQSASRFVDVELIAKANFLDALIHEEVLPVAMAWSSPRLGPCARADRRELFRNPRFCHEIEAFSENSAEISCETEPEMRSDRNSPGVSPGDSEMPARHEDARTPGTDG